jgi:hypothetical protein
MDLSVNSNANDLSFTQYAITDLEYYNCCSVDAQRFPPSSNHHGD